MNLTPVVSSNVAAIGYLETERILLVRYKDGAVYAWPEIEADGFAQFAAAGSKGKWLAALQALPAVLITKGGRHAVAPPKAGAVGTREADKETPVFGSGGADSIPAPLNVIDPESSKCCRKLFWRHGDNLRDMTSFQCAECGQDFMPETVGPNRYWRIVPQVHIVRPK